MKEEVPSAQERLEALKEWSKITHEIGTLRALNVYPFLYFAREQYEQLGLPVRLELEARYGRILMPRISTDPFLKDAHVTLYDRERDGIALNYPKLSYVLEVAKDNIIYMKGKEAEQHLTAYAVTVVESGNIRFVKEERVRNRITETRKIRTSMIVDSIRPSELDQIRLKKGLNTLLPDLVSQ